MISDNWEDWYRALKRHDYEIYQKAINYAEANTLNFRLPTKVGAEIERTMVMFACEILGVKAEKLK